MIYIISSFGVRGMSKKSCYNHAEEKRLKRTKRVTTDLLLFGAMWVLHDKFGFGKVRLLRFWNEMFALMDSISRGYLKISDLKEQLYKECGLTFEEVNNEI